jgi:hypothetical protein
MTYLFVFHLGLCLPPNFLYFAFFSIVWELCVLLVGVILLELFVLLHLQPTYALCDERDDATSIVQIRCCSHELRHSVGRHGAPSHA